MFLGETQLVLDIDLDFHLDLLNEHVRICKEKNNARNSPEEIKKRQLFAAKKVEKDLYNWRNQGGGLTNNLRNLDIQLVKVSGDDVVTTKGASVPLSHAKRLINLIEKGLVKAGARIGHFSFDSIKEDIVTIGCHKIKYSDARNLILGQG